jgi:hypothetical protein
MATHDEIRALKDRHGRKLMASPGVSGVGIEKKNDDDYELVVHLDDDAARAALPAQLDGHDVKYTVSGPFRKLPARDEGR